MISHANDAEQQYIDSMLKSETDAPLMDSNTYTTEPTALSNEPASAGITLPARPVENGLTTPEPGHSNVESDNLYQVFQLAGIRLAVAVDDMDLAIDAEAAEQHGNMLQTPHGVCRFIDLARLIRPQALGCSETVEHYIVLRGRKMAIACTRLLNIETILTDEICYRSERSQRYWLTGTVAGKNLAILDPGGICRLIDSQSNGERHE